MPDSDRIAYVIVGVGAIAIIGYFMINNKAAPPQHTAQADDKEAAEREARIKALEKKVAENDGNVDNDQTMREIQAEIKKGPRSPEYQEQQDRLYAGLQMLHGRQQQLAGGIGQVFQQQILQANAVGVLRDQVEINELRNDDNYHEGANRQQQIDAMQPSRAWMSRVVEPAANFDTVGVPGQPSPANDRSAADGNTQRGDRVVSGPVASRNHRKGDYRARSTDTISDVQRGPRRSAHDRGRTAHGAGGAGPRHGPVERARGAGSGR